ncbi:hypothetical protein CJ030_MR5G001853 [Morella rubra]|uniref:Uncharacterized protein n=1 Tax=Morella rubra TaxID=262757 RepID=A0A6A1VJB1_9ROSI|nr:hypothetical protein CJ030_MR5G001853 [Morella rubra]
MVFFMRTASDSYATSSSSGTAGSITSSLGEEKDTSTQLYSAAQAGSATPNSLDFMKSKLVLLVSHELSLSGGPLLLMELAFLLRGVGEEVIWITNQKPAEPDGVVYSLEHKMLDRGVQGQMKRVCGDFDGNIITNCYQDLLLRQIGTHQHDNLRLEHLQVFGVVCNVQWIYPVRYLCYGNLIVHVEMRYPSTCILPMTSYIFFLSMLCGIKIPQNYVVHLGNSVSRGKGQDLFLRSFHESPQLIKEKKLQVPPLHAVAVGSDMNAQTKYETELRNFVVEKKIWGHVHFVNKTLTVAPYLASIDFLVQNSQVALTGKQGLHVKNEPRAMVDLHILVFIKAGPEGIVHQFSIIANNLLKKHHKKNRSP